MAADLVGDDVQRGRVHPVPGPPALPVRIRLLIGLLTLLAGFGCLFSGVTRPLDNGLVDLRFAAAERPASGGIVFVSIDPKSLRAVGIWPWPRRVYADLLDRLFEDGARSVLLDIDFSSASDSSDDALLEAALERAGGYAGLAGFRQFAPTSGRLEITLPLPRFRAEAPVYTMNLFAEPDGVVRRALSGMTVDGVDYPSAAEALAGRTLPPDTAYHIDYSIDATTVDHVSVADVLSGAVDSARLANREVVVGAGAQELRDMFTIPRFGVVPGALAQILAAETLIDGNGPHPVGPWPVAAIILALVGLFGIVRGRLPLAGEALLAAATAVAVEIAALLAQARLGLLVTTVPVHATLALLVVAALAHELIVRRRAEAAAARERDVTRRVLDQVIADNFDGVVIIASTGRIVAASQLAETLLGRKGGLVGRQAEVVLPPTIARAVDRAFACGQSSPRPAGPGECRLAPGRLSEVAVPSRFGNSPERVVCLTFRDVSVRRRNENRLAWMAGHDPLTGALTRHKLIETMRSALASRSGQRRGISLVLLDLGRFRIINDTLGHDAGDDLLRQLVRRLEGLGFQAVARVGGDTFALVRPGVLEPEQARSLGTRVIAAAAAPFVIGTHGAVLSARAGVTDTAISGCDAERLLSDADLAVSAARAGRGDGCVLFSSRMRDRLAERQRTESALRQSLAGNGLSLVYQPQYELASRTLAGFEALVRWKHPDLGEVSPGRFVPLAEETGLIIDLGRFVLEAACREAAGWPHPITVAVNVSPMQFELGDVETDVKVALEMSGLDPRRLEIEITEGVLVASASRAIATLERLRALGVGIALDDFGTGYSSLSYLRHLPVDRLKIDQAFVRPLPGDEQATAIVASILELAHKLGSSVVAEGIEQPPQAALLTRMGCDIGQGYLFSRPVPPSAILALITGAPILPARLAAV